jgi:small conductance mechanosensitive channel
MEDQLAQQLAELRELGDMIALHGQLVVRSLLILVAGLIVIKLLNRTIKRFAAKRKLSPAVASYLSSSLNILLLGFIVVIALEYLGMRGIVIARVFIVVTLAVIGVTVIFRRYLPTLPFKVGDTVQVSGRLGKVEATTVLNTRLRTFDGKTVFMPNRKILNEDVVNYHFTPERQIRLSFGIHYDADLIKAKAVMADILAEDPRILDKPATRVFVVNLSDSSVEIAIRPWVKNSNFWRTRCDLIEKIKLGLDQEGITIAFPQRDIHIYQPTDAITGLEAEYVHQEA